MTGCPGVRRRGFGREGGGRDGRRRRRRRWRHRHHRRGDEGGEGWTPREPVGEVDARSWSSPIGDTAVLRSRPSNGAVASAGGRSRGRASSVSPRTGSTPPPRVGDALASGGDISLRWCPPLWPERRRPEVDIPTQTSRRHRGIASSMSLAHARVGRSTCNSLNTPTLRHLDARGRGGGWGIIRSIRIPWVAPSRGAS